MPQWELKVLEWWQGSVPKGCHTIFDQRAGNMKACISDPLQVELKIDNAPATYEGTINHHNSVTLIKPNQPFSPSTYYLRAVHIRIANFFGAYSCITS